MTEVTSAEVLKIAARRIKDPDPEVAALAASCLTQAPDQAGGLTERPTMTTTPKKPTDEVPEGAQDFAPTPQPEPRERLAP